MFALGADVCANRRQGIERWMCEEGWRAEFEQ